MYFNVSRTIRNNINIIAIVIIGILISGQDVYIFSQIGPALDLMKGPEGIKDAQVFGNLRNMVATMITHGLLIAVLFLVLIQPRYNTVVLPEPDKEKGIV